MSASGSYSGVWQLTGGGDVFESETILRPSVPTPPNEFFIEDDIESANLAHDANGKPSDFFLVQQGTFLSAVRLPDKSSSRRLGSMQFKTHLSL